MNFGSVRLREDKRERCGDCEGGTVTYGVNRCVGGVRETGCWMMIEVCRVVG